MTTVEKRSIHHILYQRRLELGSRVYNLKQEIEKLHNSLKEASEDYKDCKEMLDILQSEILEEDNNTALEAMHKMFAKNIVTLINDK